jgi:hydroxyethylthiazole kinase-like uncharacterized protein yjeF
MSANYTMWTEREAAGMIAVPQSNDDKYSRGVLGIITGSTKYPGAAVLGVEAALHTGVGMVRYLGPERPSTLVLSRRPEAVTANGRVQAWLIGSGIETVDGSESGEWMSEAAAQNVPLVLDGGALSLHRLAAGPVVITPHFRELATLLSVNTHEIVGDPGGAAASAAVTLGVTVLLKGHTTFVASPSGLLLSAQVAPTWLATAGAGDALGGILGALVATHADGVHADPNELARLAATAAVIHGVAAGRASRGGPVPILDVATEVGATVGVLLEH